MKIRNIIIIGISTFVLSSLFAFKLLSTSWNINANDAKISFIMPNGDKTGTISGLDATIDFDPTDIKLFTMKATVQVSTINTGIPKLNGHLQTPDFFDAANHPAISFTTESISKNDSGFVATGKLAMRDSVHTIDVPFTFVQNGKGAIIKGQMDFFSSDYGVAKKNEKKSDRVIVTIEIPLTQK
ncbi:MAG: YceI family protein [Bacteroidetes bacterium]|nr:YceI family protein [Bacteroidota bacterium]